MNTDKLLHGGLGITFPTFDLSKIAAVQPTRFDKILTGITKVGTTVATVKNAFEKPGKVTSANAGGGTTPTPDPKEGPNYLKIGLILGGVALASYAGYKVVTANKG